MLIYLDRAEQHTEANRIEITVGDISYNISVNKFEELVINKVVFDNSDGALMIKPSVSNEIRII